MTSKIIVLLLLTAAQLAAVAQQNLQFSQYAFNGLSVNPAYAGYKEAWYFNTTYRHQWTDMPGAPRTGIVSVDGTVRSREKRVGLGLQCMFDKLGPQQALALYAHYAYRIPLNKAGDRRLCFGLGAGATQYSLDGTALQYNNDNDPAIPLAHVRRIIPDFRFGIYYFTPRYYAGISVMDLLSEYTDGSRYNWKGNDYATIRKIRHYYLTAGALWHLSGQVSCKPSFLLKEDLKGPTSLDLNVSFLLRELVWAGVSWRTGLQLWNKGHLQQDLTLKDALGFMVAIYATRNMRIGYAYDHTLNGLASHENGAHEISLGYTLHARRNRYF